MICGRGRPYHTVDGFFARTWARSDEDVDPRQRPTGALVATRGGVFSYNGRMNEENNEKLPPVEGDVESPAPVKPEKVELPAEFIAARASQATKTSWDSSSRPGKWSTIGCGLGIVVLVSALFAGSSLLRKTVWAGYSGTGARLVANLPGDLPPGERMRLTRNIDRFTAMIKLQKDPYEAMGEYQRLAREAMEDHVISRDEVEEINLYLEEQLDEATGSVPYSMP